MTTTNTVTGDRRAKWQRLLNVLQLADQIQQDLLKEHNSEFCYKIHSELTDIAELCIQLRSQEQRNTQH